MSLLKFLLDTYIDQKLIESGVFKHSVLGYNLFPKEICYTYNFIVGKCTKALNNRFFIAWASDDNGEGNIISVIKPRKLNSSHLTFKEQVQLYNVFPDSSHFDYNEENHLAYMYKLIHNANMFPLMAMINNLDKTKLTEEGSDRYLSRQQKIYLNYYLLDWLSNAHFIEGKIK